MEYHYPAEFIVPTYVPYDIGPIGHAVETEFERPEMPVGLQFHDMLQGILVTGGTASQRFLTNFRLAYETAIAEGNYLIITTNSEWRRILDLVPDACVLRVGEDLTINILDPEETELSEYATILTQAFTQIFYLSQLGAEHLLQSIMTILHSPQTPVLEDLLSNLESKIIEPRGHAGKELSMVFQFLRNMGYGPASRAIGSTNIPFARLMRRITIIELDLKVQQQLRFFLFCLLAKALAYSHTYPHQNCMILVDIADFLTPIDPYHPKIREIEPYFLDWIRRFRENGLGLHLSIQIPGRIPVTILNSFKTILAHQITSFQDIKVIRDLLQFLPDRMVHSNLRHDNYQVEYLKTLPGDIFILKRPDISNAFPVRLLKFDFSITHRWDVMELQDRIHLVFPEWVRPQPVPRTLIEKDFGQDTPIVLKILSLLEEYPELGKQGFLSSLNSDPEIDLDMLQFDRLLHKLVQSNYIIANEWEDARGRRHYSYQLKEKGEQAYYEYLREIQEHLQE